MQVLQEQKPARVRPWRYSLQNSTPCQSPIEFSVLFELLFPLLLQESRNSG